MISRMSILNKIKAIVRKTGNAVLWRGRPKENDISEKIAQKIQKNSYDLSQREVKDSFTPPYLKLVEQLQVDEDQIFQAAAYSLSNIAIVRSKYREPVLEILHKFASDENKNLEKRKYIRAKIAEINHSVAQKVQNS